MGSWEHTWCYSKVDITYLMRTGVVRLLVAVLDANAVPTDADIMVNRNMYRIFFKVDEILRDEEDFNQDNDDFWTTRMTVLRIKRWKMPVILVIKEVTSQREMNRSLILHLSLARCYLTNRLHC